MIAKLMRALPMIVLAALFLAAVWFLQGCAPTALTAALVHQSVPFKGPGAPPIGDHERSPESNLDGVEVGAEWERGHLFGDAQIIYAIDRTRMWPGPWFFQARMGLRLRLGQRPPKRPPPAGQGPLPTVEPVWPEDPDPWGTLNPRPKKAKAP